MLPDWLVYKPNFDSISTEHINEGGNKARYLDATSKKIRPCNSLNCKALSQMVPPARIERATCGLGNRRSILLSYESMYINQRVTEIRFGFLVQKVPQLSHGISALYRVDMSYFKNKNTLGAAVNGDEGTVPSSPFSFRSVTQHHDGSLSLKKRQLTPSLSFNYPTDIP